VKRLLNLATETLAGIRALPSIHTLAQEADDARVSERARLYAQCRTDKHRSGLEEKLEAQRRTIEELRNNARLERERLTNRIQELKERSDADWRDYRGIKSQCDGIIDTLAKDLDLERFLGDERWAWARERILGEQQHSKELDEVLRAFKKASVYRIESLERDLTGSRRATSEAIEEVCRLRALNVKQPTETTTQGSEAMTRETIDGLKAKLAAAGAEIARLSATNHIGEKPASLTYEMVTNRSRNGKSLQAVMTRSDGLVARSSWWDIDDGSSESEASDRMRELEKKEEEDDGKEDFDPDKCTCFISPPCGYCTSGNVREL